MDNRRVLRIVNGYFTEFLGRIPDDGWGLPTPCDEWTVRDVVHHVSTGHAAFVSALNHESSPTPTASPDPGDDPESTCRWWAARAQAAIEEPGALERTVRHSMFGALSGDALALIRWGDVCVHTWDLAQAIGSDFTPDSDLAAAALEWLLSFAPDLSSTGAFSSAVDPGSDVDPFTRVLALTGRLTS